MSDKIDPEMLANLDLMLSMEEVENLDLAEDMTELEEATDNDSESRQEAP